MNKTTGLATCLLLALVPSVHAQFQRGRAPTRDATTHEELSEQRRKAAADVLNTGTPVKGPDPAKEWRPGDLMERSQVLSSNGLATLVPKGAVIHVPAEFQARLKFEPNAELHTWAEFFAANRGWIQTQEVTRDQAGGKAPIDQAVVEAMKRSPYLIVATMKGGPISVLPPKAPADGQATAQVPQDTTKP